MDTSLLVVVLVGSLLLAGAVILLLALLFMQARNSAEKKLLIWQQNRLEIIQFHEQCGAVPEGWVQLHHDHARGSGEAVGSSRRRDCAEAVGAVEQGRN